MPYMNYRRSFPSTCEKKKCTVKCVTQKQKISRWSPRKAPRIQSVSQYVSICANLAFPSEGSGYQVRTYCVFCGPTCHLSTYSTTKSAIIELCDSDRMLFSPLVKRCSAAKRMRSFFFFPTFVIAKRYHACMLSRRESSTESSSPLDRIQLRAASMSSPVSASARSHQCTGNPISAMCAVSGFIFAGEEHKPGSFFVQHEKNEDKSIVKQQLGEGEGHALP